MELLSRDSNGTPFLRFEMELLSRDSNGTPFLRFEMELLSRDSCSTHLSNHSSDSTEIAVPLLKFFKIANA